MLFHADRLFSDDSTDRQEPNLRDVRQFRPMAADIHEYIEDLAVKASWTSTIQLEGWPLPKFQDTSTYVRTYVQQAYVLTYVRTYTRNLVFRSATPRMRRAQVEDNWGAPCGRKATQSAASRAALPRRRKSLVNADAVPRAVIVLVPPGASLHPRRSPLLGNRSRPRSC